MEDTVQVIDGMLGTLLDISKLDAGVLQTNVGPLEIGKLFSQLEAEFQPLARESGNRLRIRPSRLWAHSDPCLLLRMLGNLVANALKFTQGGRVLIAARVRGDRLSLEVYDTGPGIPAEQHEAIFQEFHQLGNPHRDRRQGLGLGLGLAIVRRLGLLLDHAVAIRSRPGRGSCFSIRVALAAPRPVERPGEADRSLNGDEFRGARVMLLDDDIIVQTAMTCLLSGWGCQVLTAGSVQQALDHLDGLETPPDLLIADYRLPGNTTGAEALELLHARLGQQAPALIVTGDTSPERLREAESKGYPLLHKPATPEKLRSFIRNNLEGRITPAGPC
jgi:CheY-like chemotaxis protein/anti-sigma regulatory factor (Ser/Thr protein kinase)